MLCRTSKYILIAAIFAAIACFDARAQFKEDAFTQSYNDDQATSKDSVDVLFSFKEYFGGLAHKQEIKIGTSFMGSAIFVGGMQIYNKQYWKLPFVYLPMAAGIAGGLHHSDDKTLSTICFAGAGLTYWATCLDGVINYKPDPYPLSGKATLYSVLLPGLGQIYNGEFWKLPIYWGGLMGSAYFYYNNSVNYERFRRIYKNATSTQEGYVYEGPISAETALYYRDIYRRYRDYSVVAFAAFYLLQIIDANVFSYMHNFDVSDDFAISLEPSVISPNNSLALNSNAAFGFKFGITF